MPVKLLFFLITILTINATRKIIYKLFFLNTVYKISIQSINAYKFILNTYFYLNKFTKILPFK